MAATPEQIAMLDAKLLKENICQRDGAAGRKLSYIEGHHAIREANRIFGFDGWSARQLDLRLIGQFESEGKTNVAYSCTYSIEALGVTKQDTGYGDGTDRNANKAHELAMKEAVTDARKRCLMMFGDQFGLALYDKEQEHVEKSTPPVSSPTPFQIAVEEYKVVHNRLNFPPMAEVKEDLMTLCGRTEGPLTEADFRWLKDWAESVEKGTDDIPVAWTDRVKVALSNGAKP